MMQSAGLHHIVFQKRFYKPDQKCGRNIRCHGYKPLRTGRHQRESFVIIAAKHGKALRSAFYNLGDLGIFA